MKNILVLCTGNSCRSQIAHGWLNYFSGKTIKIYSAGIEVHELNPMTIKTMNEIGLDISHHTSNLVSEYDDVSFNFIITVCDHASKNCPIVTSKKAKRVHCNFNDPSKIKEDINTIKNSFRKTRNEIRDFCKKFILENIS